MGFDLTREIKLDQKSHKLYRKLQASLYLASFLGAIYLALLILFPITPFTFDFSRPSSSFNTLSSVHTDAGQNLKNGQMQAGRELFLDASLNGNNSEAQVEFQLAKDSPQPINDNTIAVKKSYQAFLFPAGDSIGFKDGTLLFDGINYYIVSAGQTRKFNNIKLIDSLGYAKNSFIAISKEDLLYNQSGADISDSNVYPDATIFRINGAYYALNKGELDKFISEAAYLSQYPAGLAIQKDADFLQKYSLGKNPIGFSDGSLIAYGISAFIVSGQNILPISSPVTFTSFGLDWNDIIPVSGDEFSMYAKGKLFGLTGIHPDGTIFATDDGKFYLVKNGEKHLLPTPAIAGSWLKKKPIPVSARSVVASSACNITKNKLSFGNYYSCSIPLNSLRNNIGKDYVFAVNAGDINISKINIIFKKDYTFGNLRESLSSLFHSVINKYVPTN